jgi:rod shape determining protein RodA
MTRRQLLRRISAHLDMQLLAGIGMLMVVSLLTLYSASDHSMERVMMQGANVLVGLCCMWIVANLPLHYLMRTAVPIYAAGMVLLLGVLTPLGVSSHGATRWPGISSCTRRV